MVLGRSTYEQDAYRIRPLVIERSRLTRSVAATATTIYINSLPRNVAAYGGYVVIDPYTTECEVRLVTARTGKILTIAALTYAHTKYDEVMFVDSPILHARWFGAKGDDSTDDYTALSRALSTAATLDSILWMDKGIYRIGTGLSMTNTCSMIGESPWDTEIKATANITMLTVGVAGGADCRNSRVENIRFNGNSAAGIGISVGDSPLSTFRNLEITGVTAGTGKGVVLDHSQNQTWDCVRSTANDINFYIINGAGNCGFFNCHGTAPVVTNLQLTQDATFPGVSGTPTGHGFYSCIFETGLSSTVDAKPAYIVRGKMLYFARCNFTRHASATVPCIDMDSTANLIVFDACRINSNTEDVVDMVHADGYDISFEHCWFIKTEDDEAITSGTTLVTTANATAWVNFNSQIPTAAVFDTSGGGWVHKHISSKWVSLPKAETVIISGGTATITQSFVALMGQGTAADSLDYIRSSGTVGDIVVFQASSATVDVTITDAGNINLGSAGTITLTNTLQKIAFQCNAVGDWDEYFRSIN